MMNAFNEWKLNTIVSRYYSHASSVGELPGWTLKEGVGVDFNEIQNQIFFSLLPSRDIVLEHFNSDPTANLFFFFVSLNVNTENSFAGDSF